MFGVHADCKEREATLWQRIRDLESDLKENQDAWEKERQQLIDKIMAMANPQAVREFRRIPLEGMQNFIKNRDEGAQDPRLEKLRNNGPVRYHYPGVRVPTRPDTMMPDVPRKTAGRPAPEESDAVVAISKAVSQLPKASE